MTLVRLRGIKELTGESLATQKEESRMSSQPPYGYGQGGSGYGAPPPPPPGQTPGKTKTLNLDYNVAALLNYIPMCFCCLNVISCILWLATEPRENRFLRFHSIQGLLLGGVWVVCWILFQIIGLGMGFGSSFDPTAGIAFAGGALILWLIEMAIGVVLLIISIVAMVKAFQQQMWKIPVIGDIAEKNS
jgi:uncharacterized membrane protein